MAGWRGRWNAGGSHLGGQPGRQHPGERDDSGAARALGPELRFSAVPATHLARSSRAIADVALGTAASVVPASTNIEIDAGVQILLIGFPLTITAGGGAGLLQGIGALVRARASRCITIRSRVAIVIRTASATIRSACPADAEDKDGFEDGDGCPEVDNDQDNTSRTRATGCAAQPEDYDGFEDHGWLPGDWTTTRTASWDERDACKLEPETKNDLRTTTVAPTRRTPTATA